MIGALLSNTPTNLLRSNGVAGETASGSGENTPNRDQLTARESHASPRAAALRAGNSAVLTSQAVLALQDSESLKAQDDKAGHSGDGEQESALNSQEPEADKMAGGNPDSDQAGAEGQAGHGALAQSQESADKEEDPDGDGLNEAEEKQVKELAKRDREVKAHEQAHARVGGAYAGAPSYTFQQGPDGKRYAVGGEVQIDTAKEKTPEATIRKMQIVIRAATAPAEPSSQDMKVAQQARSQLSEAQGQLRQQKTEELSGDGEDGVTPSETGSTPDLAPDPASATGAEPEASDNKFSKATTAPEDGQKSSQIRNEEAVSAYRSAVEQVAEAQSLFNSLVV
jgi:SprA family protein